MGEDKQIIALKSIYYYINLKYQMVSTN